MCHTRTGHRADDRELRRRGRVAVGVGVRVDGKFRRSVGCSLCRLHVQRTGTKLWPLGATQRSAHTERRADGRTQSTEESGERADRGGQ